MSKVNGNSETLRITRVNDNITEVTFAYYDGGPQRFRLRTIQLQLDTPTIAKIVATALGQCPSAE